jgi:hypothetical protein
MRQRIAFVVLLLLSGLFLAAQAIDTVKVPGVPPDGSGGVKYPGIAANSRGDVMVVFRNKNRNMMYYFKKKGGGSVGPEKIPGTFEETIHSSHCTLVATADDHFHAVWNSDLEPKGMFYSEFDIASERWGAITRLSDVESRYPLILLNPVNNDLAIVTILRFTGNDVVSVYFRRAGQGSWSSPLNISQGAWVNQSQGCFDEEGYLYLAYREELRSGEESYFVKVVLLKAGSDGQYQKVSSHDVTRAYPGYHFLPSIAATSGKGMLTFVWTQKKSYYYVPFTRSGDTLTYDAAKAIAVADAPTKPWFRYYSKALAHGDEIFYVYTDMQFTLNLLRWKDGQWLTPQPIALMNEPLNKFPFQVYAEPNFGFYTIWFWEAEKGDGVTSYCLYDLPKPRIGAPLAVKAEKVAERSFFHAIPAYSVTWAANPINAENDIVVVGYRVYRRPAGGGSWTRVGQADKDTLRFVDVNGVTAASDFVYGVSAVNDEDQESAIEPSSASGVGLDAASARLDGRREREQD